MYMTTYVRVLEKFISLDPDGRNGFNHCLWVAEWEDARKDALAVQGIKSFVKKTDESIGLGGEGEIGSD
jgi:hypothetical protein